MRTRAARVYAWFHETPARTHWGHGLLAFGIALAVTLLVHAILFRWMVWFGGMPGWASWLVAGSYGLVAGASFYTNREIEQQLRRWLSGEIPSLEAGLRQHDPTWDVIAAWIGAAVPGPLLAFGPDLLAALL